MILSKTLRHLFTPHFSNNHRSHLLQPVGISILIGLLLITNSSIELIKAAAPSGIAIGRGGLVLGYASDITADQVLIQTNEERTKAGLLPLELNSQLTAAALAKANDMFANDYWAHTSPSGTTPWVFIKAAGYKYSVAGENLARDFDDTPSMVTAWMNSPTHKANIVHPKYTQTGIAVVNGTLDGVETTLVVHMFGTPPGVVAQVTNSPPPAPQLASGTQTGSPVVTNQPIAAVNPHSDSVLSQASENQTPTYISPTKIKQSVAFAMVLLLITILVADEIIINRRKTVRFVGRNWAHLGFLAAVLLIIALSSGGGII